MSLVPLMYRDWWDEFEQRPSRLLDQNFGIGLTRDDLWNTISNYRPASSLLRSGYYRPWGPVARQDSGSSSITADKNKVQVILDVQQFTPEEITVKAVDNAVVVEGKHEEKQDEHGYISRHFVRRYLLPKDVELGNITSSLSSDGVLTITAPKKTADSGKGERAIPVIQTGQPAVKSKPEKETEIKIEQQK